MIRLGWYVGIVFAAGLELAMAGEKSSGQGPGDDLTPGVDKKLLPLDMLPPGTVMESVRLPRYREDQLLGEVIAAKLTVISEDEVKGERVSVRWSTAEATSAMTRAKLPTARYDFKSGLLKAREGVEIDDPRFSIRSREMDLNLSLKRGWLSGPLVTRFTRGPKALEPGNSEDMKTSLRSAVPLLAGTVLCLAEPPAKPSNADWERFENFTRPVDFSSQHPDQAEWKRFENENRPDSRHRGLAERVAREIEAEAESRQRTNAEIRRLLKQLGREDSLLIADEDQEEVEKDQEEVEKEAADFDGALEVPEFEAEGPVIQVRCKGGMYFDAEEGIFVYLKDVQVRDPDFSLDCSEQLKIELARDAEKTAGGAEKSGEAGAAENLKSFGSVKRMAATGAVVVVTRDKDGQEITASADKVTYEAETGEILMTGRELTVVTAEGKQEVSGPNAFIKITRDGGVVADGASKTFFEKPKNG